MLGLITGIASEAAAALRAVRALRLEQHVRVACAGPGIERAHNTAHRLIHEGAERLLSFGLAGALDPGLKPGTLILPTHILGPQGIALPVDSNIHESLTAMLAPLTKSTGLLVSTQRIIDNAQSKKALAAESRAVAVDMESFGVAAAATGAKIPFAVLRAIADPAERSVPLAAQKGVDPDGRLRPLAVMAELLRYPSELADIARLARDNNRAMRALGRAARLALPLLVFGR